MIRLLLLACMTAAPVFAGSADQAGYFDDSTSEGHDLFVEANLVGTFYHELGHALIDTMDLPVLGREEDAADTLSVLLIDEIWEPESALAIAQGTAVAWMLSAAEAEEEDPAFWDVHGHDLQRYYNTVCLWYGGDPDNRGDFATEFELPPERAETCSEEFDQAWSSWFAYLDEAVEGAPGKALSFVGETADPASRIIAEEVRSVNALLALPVDITVSVEQCGEANAFYDPAEKHIEICQEYGDWLSATAVQVDL